MYNGVEQALFTQTFYFSSDEGDSNDEENYNYDENSNEEENKNVRSRSYMQCVERCQNLP